MKKPVILGIVFVVIILTVIIYSSMNLSKFKVEVCMQYNGSTNCRVASGANRDDTLRTAVTNACGGIAQGMTESMQCQNTQPVSVRWIKEE